MIEEKIEYRKLSQDDKSTYSQAKKYGILGHLKFEDAECQKCHGSGTYSWYTSQTAQGWDEGDCFNCQGTGTHTQLTWDDKGQQIVDAIDKLEAEKADARQEQKKIEDRKKKVQRNFDAIKLLDTAIAYGKHKGTYYKDLPEAYARWADQQRIGRTPAERLAFYLASDTDAYDEFFQYMEDNQERAEEILNA